jgi:hypothetical protein
MHLSGERDPCFTRKLLWPSILWTVNYESACVYHARLRRILPRI